MMTTQILSQTAMLLSAIVAIAATGIERVDRDVEGVWDFSTRTPLQRPAEYADKKYLTAEEAGVWERNLRKASEDRRLAQAGDLGNSVDEEIWAEFGRLARIDGRFPTSLIVDPPDGRLPALTPDARRRLAARRVGSQGLDGPEDRSLSERCLRALSGPPYTPSPDANTLRIMQSTNNLAITVEKFHETRIVSLDKRLHVSPAIRSWAGDSVAHWDGDALVVDTTNFTPSIGLTGNYDGNLHLTERFRRVDRDILLYTATIDDPTAFVRPWTMELAMKRIGAPLYEFACHEGNYSLPNMLSGARATEGR